MAAGVAAVAVASALFARDGVQGIDFEVYRLGGLAVLHGQDLYAVRSSHHLAFTYPPFAAVLFVPFALVPYSVGFLAWTCLVAAALVGFVRLHLARWVTTDVRLVAAVLLAACLEPIWQNFFLGQIDLLLALGVSGDLLHRPAPASRGVLTGLAIGTKLTPALFLPLLLLTGQRRALKVATLAFAGTVAAGVVLLPGDSGRYWFHDVLASGRVGNQVFANNQSVLGALLRTGPWPLLHVVWIGAAVALGSAGVLVGRAWWLRGERGVAVSATALGALLASPVSWTHHWVWCLPLTVALLVAGRRAGLTRTARGTVATVWAAGFVVAPNLWVPRHLGRELRWTPAQAFAGDTYLWLGLLALAFLATTALRASTSGLAPSPRRGRRPRAARPRTEGSGR